MAKGPAPLALGVYSVVALPSLGIALARGTSPVETEAWLSVFADAPAWWRHLASVGGGAVLALATICATRGLVRRWAWARALHADLRPAVRDAGDSALLVLGVASGVAEELFFRGLLAPSIGLVLSSVAFGALHQLRGSAGWLWATWATLMGLLFGVLFLATGSLVGAIVAHAAINVMNLRFLRDTDVEPRKPRRLGGLLGQA
jgi:membrane protease YdiL (CAAX protease family)